MLSHEDLEKLKGMKHIKYVDSEKNQEWLFMVRVNEELLSENENLKQQIRDLKEEYARNQEPE